MIMTCHFDRRKTRVKNMEPLFRKTTRPDLSLNVIHNKTSRLIGPAVRDSVAGSGTFDSLHDGAQKNFKRHFSVFTRKIYTFMRTDCNNFSQHNVHNEESSPILSNKVWMPILWTKSFAIMTLFSPRWLPIRQK